MKAKLNQNKYMGITKVGSLYSGINLINMMKNEDKYILGAGPANFLSRAGDGPLRDKYGSYSIFRFGSLSSSDWIENSFVGLAGEVGFIGWYFYILFYLAILKKYIYLSKISDSYIYLFGILLLFYFIVSSFFRNTFEDIETMVPVIIFAFFALDINTTNHNKKYMITSNNHYI
jgi:hypothetical protein